MEYEIVQAILNGDTERYAEIVEQYQQLVANLCYKLGGANIDVEETTQKVFVELYTSLHRFEYRSKLSTFIYKITANTVFKTLKNNSRYVKLSDYDSLMTEACFADVKVMNDDRNKQLYKAMDKLNIEQKTALTLCYFEEMSYKEVAETMGVTLAKVETLIFRAKKNLKKILSDTI